MVRLETDMGDIFIELDDEKAPKSAANFLKYVESGHYDGTIFHRVIDGFMVQGGGMNAEMKEQATGDPLENEADNGLTNDAYTVAMARTMDPHSATAQFFINVADNKFLDHPGQDGWGYCVFGKVVNGMEVLDKLKGVETTTRGGHQDVPADDILIEKATIDEA